MRKEKDFLCFHSSCVFSLEVSTSVKVLFTPRDDQGTLTQCTSDVSAEGNVMLEHARTQTQKNSEAARRNFVLATEDVSVGLHFCRGKNE